MPKIVHVIRLSEEERKRLRKIVSTKPSKARTIRAANVLLALDTSGGRESLTMAEYAKAFVVSRSTVRNIKAKYDREGLDA